MFVTRKDKISSKPKYYQTNFDPNFYFHVSFKVESLTCINVHDLGKLSFRSKGCFLFPQLLVAGSRLYQWLRSLFSEETQFSYF